MKNIMVLGGRAAGKTMFIAGLAEYCRASRSGCLKLVPLDDDSRAYLSRVQEYLRVGQWPPATSDVHFVSFRLVTRDQQELVLEVVDYPGEVVELLHGGQDLGPWRTVLDSLPGVDKVLLLLSLDFDLPEIDDADSDEQRNRQDAAAGLLTRLTDLQQAGAASMRGLDVIPVVTKSDLQEGLTGAEADQGARDRMDRRTHRLLESLETLGMQVHDTQFVTAVGHVIREGDGSTTTPPAGAMEPSGFAELVDEIRRADEKKKAGAIVRRLMVGVVLVAALCLAWWGRVLYQQQAIGRAADSGSTQTVLNLASEKLDSTSDAGAKVRQRLLQELDEIESRLASAPSRNVLEEGVQELEDLLGNPNNPQIGRTQSLKERFVARIEGRIIDEIEGAPTYESLLASFADYEERFGASGPRSGEVKAILDRRRAQEQARIRRSAIQIDADTRERIRMRHQRSLEFIERFPNDVRADELRLANEVADHLCSATSIEVSVSRIDIEDADGGDGVRIEFWGDASKSADRPLQESRTKKGKETTWNAKDGASHSLDLSSVSRTVVIAVRDPGDGLFNFKDDWGMVSIQPLQDFVFGELKMALTKDGSRFFTGLSEPARKDERRPVVPFSAMIMNASVPGLGTPFLSAAWEAAIEELAASEESVEVLGAIKVRLTVWTGSVEDAFTDEERSAYLRFYLTAEGWNLGE